MVSVGLGGGGSGISRFGGGGGGYYSIVPSYWNVVVHFESNLHVQGDPKVAQNRHNSRTEHSKIMLFKSCQ